MSQGKRLVLDQDDFLGDDDDDQQQQQSNAKPQPSNGNGNQQKISVSASSSGPQTSPGKTRDELMAVADAHRKSLIGIAGDGRGFTADDLEQLSSVTLSKRHNFSTAEYEGGADPKVYENLSQFNFEKAEQQTAAAAQNGGASSGALGNGDKK